MPHPKSEITNYKSRIPTYLPLDQAARKYGLSKTVLTQQIQAGKIEAVQLPTGELLVAANENNGATHKTKEQIIAREFAHLRGKAISASEASRKYSKNDVMLSPQNFSHWAKAGYIKVMERGYRLQLDESDVAYCAKIYIEKYHEYEGQMAGVHVFDNNGNPYKLKYREVADQMRASRREKKRKKIAVLP